MINSADPAAPEAAVEFFSERQVKNDGRDGPGGYFERSMGRPRSYDRNEVIARATALFWKKGYAGAHLQELVEVTGLNRFSLYKEFGGKDGLFQTAIESYLNEADDYYRQTLGRKPYGLANITAYFRSIRFPAQYDGCFFVNSLAERHVLESATYKLVQKFAAYVEDLYFKNAQAAQKSGELPTRYDARTLARYFTVNDFGLAVFGINGPPRNRGLPELLDLILSAIGATGETAASGSDAPQSWRTLV